MTIRWMVAAVLAFAAAAAAAVRPAPVFTDDMVLQRDIPVPVRGTAAPGETVTVRFAGQAVTAVADAAGNWRADLAPLTVSAAPAELIISGADSSVTLTNVLVGDVWLCSGQSNMAFTMRMLKLPDEEIQAATNYPLLRLFTVAAKTNPRQPETDVKGAWAVSSEKFAGGFSGTAAYFGRALCRDLGVPVGLICSAVSGTPAEAWTSREALEQLPFMPDRLKRADQARATYDPAAAQADFKKKMAEWRRKIDAGEPAGQQPRLWNPQTGTGEPATLYNGMIAPLIPFAIRGVIWYQGESNAGRHAQYRDLFSAMITDWRRRWGQGDVPFLFVQLASFHALQDEPVETHDSWPYLREAQQQTLALPNTAMAVTTDVGDATDIHPRDKKTVGERLALAARAVAYGENIVSSGPLFRSWKINDGEAVIHFDHTGGGLTVNGNELKGFAVQGKDGNWHWADARIDGDTVIVRSPDVPEPAAVRYNWADNPVGNLFNREGMPTSLFRTDR